MTRTTLAFAALTVGFGLLLPACGEEDPSGAAPGSDEDAQGGGDIEAEDVETDFGPTPRDGLKDGYGADSEDTEESDSGEDTVDPDATEEPDTWTPPVNPCAGLASGAECDDGDPCTTGDACAFGECTGEPYTCSDGLGCTRDECDGFGGCTFPVRGDRCLIDSACYEDGDAGPGGCLSCVPPISRTDWTADDTLPCDDGDFCSTGDFCYGGVCVGGTYKDCDDGNWCTDDGCGEFGCTKEFNTRQCDDGDPCSMADVCTNGVCLPGDGALCDDGNPCTSDACLFGACFHDESDGACDDGDTCTIGDTCVDGECTPTSELSCHDGNPCTDDVCHPKGGCVTKFNTSSCSDGDPCTLGDVCSFGQCKTGAFKTLCNDANPCTEDYCDPVGGSCKHDPNNGIACTDGNPCTLGDFCEGGLCKSGGLGVECDDGNDCTDDYCGPAGTCVFNANLLPCSDGDPCTLGDQCADSSCHPGTGLKNCSDANPCTDDWCEPGEGCINAPNSIVCNDGNACTVGDQCINAKCVPGNTGAACDDQNPCTDDACVVDKGCVNAPNNLLCDDGEACTVSDQCEGGVCMGESGDCDDGNECTKEICLAGGGCQHVPINSFECKPRIVFINPPRGAMLKGPQPVFVTGYVTVGGAGMQDFFVNGFEVETDPVSGAFSFMMEPEVGLNVIHAIATSKLGGQDEAIRSFSWSTKYHPPGATVPAGIGLWLSQMVWDDDNTSNLDDIATVMTLMLGEFDLASMIPNPLAETGALHCDFTVYADPVYIGQPQIDLITKNQALGVTVRYPNLFVGLDVDADGFLCPGISGDISASAIEVSIDLGIQADGNGNVMVSMNNPTASVKDLDIDLDGILGFLFNWIIDLFEGSIATQVETMVASQLDIVPETMAEALESLALDQEFELPALVGDGQPTTLSMQSSLSGADFDQFGGFLELGTKIDAGAKKVPYVTQGSLARDKCADMEDADFFDYLMQSEIEIALKDDMLNQMLHAAWFAGGFEMPLPASFLGDVDLTEYGVEIIDLSISMLLPPILSSCNYEDNLQLGIGDIKVHTSLILFGQPLEVTAYASAIIDAEVVVIEELDGNTMGIALDEIIVFGVEVEDVSAGFEGAQGAVEELIGQFIGPELFASLGGEALGAIPIPSIPLDGFHESIPSGTALVIALQKIYRLGGRTVMAGNAMAGSSQ